MPAKIAEKNFAGIVPLLGIVDIASEIFMDVICALKCLLMMSSGFVLTIADAVSLVISGQWWISGNSFLTSPLATSIVQRNVTTIIHRES